MKLIKKYESFREFDINFAIAKIKHFYSEYDVKSMLDDEIENWVDDNNLTEISRSGNEYETKTEWYDEHGCGEAEEVVAEQLVDWYENEFSVEITEDQKEDLVDVILKSYDSLQH